MQITIEELKKIYGTQTVLDIALLNIRPGELVGIVGNNGAGKTTLLRLMLDLIKADQGFVRFGEEKVHEGHSWKKFTGSYIDEGFLIDFLTPEEYFHFTGQVYGMSKKEVNSRLELFSRFMNNEIMGVGKYIRQLSTGNKQKVGIVAAMLANPDVLILDEPFNFLDPTSQIIMRNRLKEINKSRQTTMLISSHNINHLAEICSRIILLENGRIIKDLQPERGQLAEIEGYFLNQVD
jgi:ABC-2 type transport system ATP-binding protein